MLRKFKKDEIDKKSVNEILFLCKRLLKIFLFIAITSSILLVTYVVQEWNVFAIVKSFIVVISPLLFGILIAWLFRPIATYLESKKVPRLLACLIPYVLIWGMLIGAVCMMLPTFVNQVIEFSKVIPDIFNDLTNNIQNIFNSDMISFEEKINSMVSSVTTNITSVLPDLAISIGSRVFSFGLNIFLSLMIGFYLLYDSQKFNTFMYNITPNSWKMGALELSSRVNSSLRGYVQGVLIIMFLIFVCQSIGLTLAGIDAPLVFALFCALTNVIPYFGPYIGGFPAIIVGFTISPVVGVGVLISIVVVQILENTFFQPLIMGHTMKLHPVVIIISLLIFQQLFGIVGMIVATPIVATIKIILMFVDEKLQVLKKINNNIINDDKR